MTRNDRRRIMIAKDRLGRAFPAVARNRWVISLSGGAIYLTARKRGRITTLRDEIDSLRKIQRAFR